jgi:tRNA (cytidine/uridine-2'-O-)-methyltransferase
MFNIVLVHPEIPANTGNIIRLSANTGCTLHLIEPLGFLLESSKLKRAGLDYHEFANLQVHKSWLDFISTVKPQPEKMHALTTKSSHSITKANFKVGDFLIFGNETSGLPEEVRGQISLTNRWRLPMMPDSRSLNLSNSVAVVTYEAWRQNGFQNGV